MNNKAKILLGAGIGLIVIAIVIILLTGKEKSYNVTFDTDGGSHELAQVITKGDVIVKPADPTREGYKFVRWELNGKEYDFTTPVEGDVSLKAIWEKIEEAPKYKLTFTVDGQTKELEVSNVNEIKLDDLGFEEKDGYDIEWLVDGEKFDPTMPITADMNITGKYVKVNYLTVKFNSDGGSKVDNQKVKSKDKATEPTNPTKYGFIFDGWYLNSKKYDFNTEVTKNITLTAKWEEDPSVPRYKVTFDSDGGSKVTEQKVIEEQYATEPKVPTKEGFKFVEWQLDNKKYDFKKTKVTEDIKLKAVWRELEEFTVKFDTDGGNNIDDQKVLEDSYAKEPTKPIKEGHTFKGWLLDGKSFVFNKNKITKNITLKASWTKIESKDEYTITATRADNYSPDSILKVFKNGSQISVKEIQYNDGVKLCDGSKLVVTTSDIEGENSFIVILNDGTSVKATLK